MSAMIAKTDLNATEINGSLCLSEEQIRKLSDSGHVIGLHNQTHATLITALDPVDRYEEYSITREILASSPVVRQSACLTHAINMTNTFSKY